MKFSEAIQSLDGTSTMLDVAMEPVFPHIVKHPLTDQYMRKLMEQAMPMDPPMELLGLLRVAFAEGVSVGALMGNDPHAFEPDENGDHSHHQLHNSR